MTVSMPCGRSYLGRNGRLTDLGLNQRLTKGILGSTVGGLDRLDLKEGPKPIGLLQDLLAGAYRAGPRDSLDALTAQLNQPLMCTLEVMGNWAAALLHLIPVD